MSENTPSAAGDTGPSIDEVIASKEGRSTQLKRKLSGRHMRMIAIGGAIGTGLFVASGKTISTAGPGGAIVAYGLIGIMVLFLMQSLGEMAAHLYVEPTTIKYHLTGLLQKTGSRDRLQAVLWGIRAGMVHP